MSISTIGVNVVGPDLYRVYWTATTSGPFYVYVDGALVNTTYSTQYVMTAGDGWYPVVDVFDDATEPSGAFPGRMTFGWYALSGSDEYFVEEYSSGAWVTRAKVPDTGSAFYTYRTPVLADVTTAQWRIVPYTGEIGGTATAVNIFMVRYPDPPLVTYAYSEDDYKVTITAG